jgi:hypothetical protein
MDSFEKTVVCVIGMAIGGILAYALIDNLTAPRCTTTVDRDTSAYGSLYQLCMSHTDLYCQDYAEKGTVTKSVTSCV